MICVAHDGNTDTDFVKTYAYFLETQEVTEDGKEYLMKIAAPFYSHFASASERVGEILEAQTKFTKVNGNTKQKF